MTETILFLHYILATFFHAIFQEPITHILGTHDVISLPPSVRPWQNFLGHFESDVKIENGSHHILLPYLRFVSISVSVHPSVAIYIYIYICLYPLSLHTNEG